MCENKLSSIYHIKLLTLYSDAVETIDGASIYWPDGLL